MAGQPEFDLFLNQPAYRMADLSAFDFYGNCGHGRSPKGELCGSTAQRASRAPDRLPKNVMVGREDFLSDTMVVDQKYP